MRRNIFTAVAIAVLSASAAIELAGPAGAAPTAVMADDGLYVVAVDIVPGVYASAGPADEYGCYWERLSGTSGEFDDIIANDFVDSGRMRVTIKPTDHAFNSQGCGTWTLVPAP